MTIYVSTNMRFQERVAEVAKQDSDDLVYFYEGLRNVLRDMHRSTAVIRRVSGYTSLIIFADGRAGLKVNSDDDRLTFAQMERFLSNRDVENAAALNVYDLVDDLWRVLNGQEIENPPSIRLGVT